MLAIIILGALIKLNLLIEKPVVTASIFTACAFILGLLFQLPLAAVLINASVNFGLAFLFFLLLKRTEGRGLWWAVVVGGMLVFIGLSIGLSLIR